MPYACVSVSLPFACRYFKDPNLNVENMATVSKAGKGLLVWVTAITKYYDVAKNVEPLRIKVGSRLVAVGGDWWRWEEKEECERCHQEVYARVYLSVGGASCRHVIIPAGLGDVGAGEAGCCGAMK